MKTIVYLSDGSIESTANHAAQVEAGIARYATDAEAASYERFFEHCDALYFSDARFNSSAAGYRN